MVDVKDKLVSLELLKFYHDYNKATYANITKLVYNGSAIIDGDGTAVSFTKMSEILSESTCNIEIAYNAITLIRVAKSTSSIDFIGFHEASGKMYIDKLSVSSSNRITYREVQLALSGDIIKNLAGMTDDATHRTVTDEQINTWNNKSDFSGDWADLDNKPIATVAQTKQFLSIQ